jgi:chaperonin GroEL
VRTKTRRSASASCARAIEEPLRQIVENAGEDAAVVLNEVESGKGDLRLQRRRPASYGDMLEVGILDPAKVTRLALQNAASVAGLLLTTEVMIAEAPKDDARPRAPGAGWHGRHGHVTRERC